MKLVLILAVALAALAVDFLVAREFSLAASMKGWPSRKYFFYAFFLPVIGYLLVLALPDRGSADVGSFRSRDLPEL